MSSKDTMEQLTPEHIAILRAFTKVDPGWCYPYSYFESETGLDRKVLQKHMKELARAGYVKYERGLMSEEGEVAGSGYGMVYARYNDIWDIVEAHRLPPTTLEFKRKLRMQGHLSMEASVALFEELDALIASEREAAVREFAEDLKQYRGAYIGIDGRRVDNMVAHQIIDERLAKWGK